MRFSLSHTSPKIKFQIDRFLSIKPIPQLQAWQALAQNLANQHFLSEAAIILDLAAGYYDKNVVRKIISNVLNVPDYRRGRGLIDAALSPQHPLVYDLRDHNAPVMFDGYVGFRIGSALHLIHPTTADCRIINPFSPTPRHYPICGIPEPWTHSPISIINIDNCLIFAPYNDDLYFIDLNDIDFSLSPEKAEKQLLPFAKIAFESPVRRICGPLNDGTFFITLAPDLAVLSDKCYLCRLDIPKIQNTIHQSTSPNTFCIRDIAHKWIQLSNIEQSLCGDICPAGDQFISCCGGMQPEEVRFIDSDGAWTARCVHHHPVVRILQTEFGPTSLDASGLIFLWNGDKIVGDMQFEPGKYQSLLQNPETSISLDWQAHNLYLIPPCDIDHLSTFSKSDSVCMGPSAVSIRPFIQKIHYLPGCAVAMFSDGNYYFWDSLNDCVQAPWQLSQRLASADDWRDVLSIQSPSVELDPRIRFYD